MGIRPIYMLLVPQQGIIFPRQITIYYCACISFFIETNVYKSSLGFFEMVIATETVTRINTTF